MRLLACLGAVLCLGVLVPEAPAEAQRGAPIHHASRVVRHRMHRTGHKVRVVGHRMRASMHRTGHRMRASIRRHM